MRLQIPAAVSSSSVLRYAHNGEVARRITASFEAAFTTTGAWTLSLLRNRNSPPQTQGSDACGTLALSNGQAVVAHHIYEMVLPATEGALPMAQEGDTYSLLVSQPGNVAVAAVVGVA